MSCPPHGAFAREKDGSNVDKYTICSDRQQQVLRAKIMQGTEIRGGWGGAFIERWRGQRRPSSDCGIRGKPKEREGTVTETSTTVRELVRGPGRGFLTCWGVGEGALDPQLPTWSSASAEILLEFQACYSDSETYSLSAQGRWTLIENKRHHPTFLSSAFKDPASKKQEGPTYISIVAVLDGVMSLEGAGPLVLAD